MNKLLAKYRSAPTETNARKVRAYERLHMMSVCMLSREDQALVADAIYHANQGFVRPDNKLCPVCGRTPAQAEKIDHSCCIDAGK